MPAAKWNHRTRITSALRRVWRFSPEAKEAKEAARVVVQERPRRVMYRCAACGCLAKDQDSQVDHVAPVVALEGFDGWDAYISRLFCGAEGLQVLCSGCHDAKTSEERLRRQVGKKKQRSKG